MTDLFLTALKNVWVVMAAVGVINVLAWSVGGWRDSTTDEQRALWVKIAFAGLVIALLPWSIMGAGLLTGAVGHILYYGMALDLDFWTQAFNPYVGAFWITFFLTALISSYWIVKGGGAELIYNHPRSRRQIIRFPLWMLRLSGYIGPLMFLMFCWVLFFQDLPFEQFDGFDDLSDGYK